MTRPTNEPLQRPYEFPIFRRPTRKQILQMLPAITRWGRLDQDPFTALMILHERNPEKVYNYTPHDSTKPDSESQFTCALADDFTVENMILHGTLDVTFLIAVDKNEHFVPGSALLSASVKTKTLSTYLTETKKKVNQRVHAIVNDPACIVHTDMKARAEILKICLEILKHGWKVPKWMIDKCLAELKAIKKDCKEFPDAYMRLCQFHVVQAILRWDTDNGTAVKKPRLPFYIKYKLIVLFRVLQRCRTMDDWPATKARFLQDACGVVMSQRSSEADSDSGKSGGEGDEEFDEHGNPGVISGSNEHQGKLAQSVSGKQVQGPKTKELLARECQQVYDYFCTNWFTDTWISTYTDIGLPRGQTRDGTWNVNNWEERSFLIFDTVFLDNRRNKRIDHLGAIILNDFFPFYQYWTGSPKRISQEHLALNYAAHKLWEDSLVSRTDKETFHILQPPYIHEFMSFKVSLCAEAHAMPSPEYSIKDYEVFIVNLVTPHCQCVSFQQTGKLCVHLVAARLELSNGPVAAWREVETENQRRHPWQKNKGAGHELKPISDETYTDQLRRTLNKLDREPVTHEPPQPTPSVHCPSLPADDEETQPRQDTSFIKLSLGTSNLEGI
ncbi:hypothetical protein K439DRAFT_1616877 [Ramaria rubella]|nr:hypothetical protein K439DRAFT_1616877 [Ramaria rubella]